MEECYRYTDLKWRLAQIPETASCRGHFLNMLDDRAADFGLEVQRQYRDYFKLYRFSALRMYSVKDYLTRMVKLAQLQFGGPKIYDGIYRIQAEVFPAWRKTLFGRTSFAILGSDFDGIVRLLSRQFSHVVNYSRMNLRIRPEGVLEVALENEYVYIEYAMVGALHGVARACQLPVKTKVRLTDPFNGIVEVEKEFNQPGRSP